MFIGRDHRQRLVDDVQQLRVFAAHRECKTTGLHRRKICQLYIAQIVFADQVMGTDGIPQIDISLTERHRAHRGQCRGEEFQLSAGIELLHAVFGQVVIKRHQPFSGQRWVQSLG
ncbi:hypothetical protein D3C81_1253280 [compost metagenome]